MAREIDERKKRKALGRIRRARDAAERAIANCPDTETAEAARRELSEWEEEFVTSLEQRLSTYGSAFADPDKGDLDQPLSRLQEMKLKEIEKKAKGKAPAGFNRGSGFKSKGSSFKRKGAPARANTRDIHADLDETPPARKPESVSPETPPARFSPRVIENASGPEPADGRKTPSRTSSPFQVIDGGKA